MLWSSLLDKLRQRCCNLAIKCY